MDDYTIGDHLLAGFIAGVDNTCTGKIDYKSEASAEKAANKMNSKPTTRHKLEHYPCVWCRGWHIGRVYEEE